MKAGEAAAPAIAGSAVPQIDSLTSLRGIAALVVVLYHFQAGPLQYALQRYTPVLDRGYLAVDLFFIMSGFVIAHVYGRTFAGRWGGRDFARYMWARFARLYPLHIATLAGMVAIYLIGETLAYGAVEIAHEGRWSWVGLVHNIFLTQGPWLPYATWNSPAWSISAEMHLYLLFPLALPLLWHAPRQYLLPILALLFAMRYAGDALGLDAAHGPAASAFRCVPAFLAGVVLYRFYCLGWLRAALSGSWPIALIVAACIAMAHLGAPDSFMLPLVVALVLAAVHCTGASARLLSLAPLVYLGEISYSVYLMHPLVDRAIYYTFEALGMKQGDLSNVQYLTFLASSILLVLIVAAASYRWLEMPARAALRRMDPTRLRRAVTAA